MSKLDLSSLQKDLGETEKTNTDLVISEIKEEGLQPKISLADLRAGNSSFEQSDVDQSIQQEDNILLQSTEDLKNESSTSIFDTSSESLKEEEKELTTSVDSNEHEIFPDLNESAILAEFEEIIVDNNDKKPIEIIDAEKVDENKKIEDKEIIKIETTSILPENQIQLQQDIIVVDDKKEEKPLQDATQIKLEQEIETINKIPEAQLKQDIDQVKVEFSKTRMTS